MIFIFINWACTDNNDELNSSTNEVISKPTEEQNTENNDNNDSDHCIHTTCDHCWTDEIEFEYYDPIFCRLVQKESTLENNMGGYSGFTTTTENCVWIDNEQRCDTQVIDNFGNEEYVPNNGSYTIFNIQGYIEEQYIIEDLNWSHITNEYTCPYGWCIPERTQIERQNNSSATYEEHDCIWYNDTNTCDISLFDEDGIRLNSIEDRKDSELNDFGYYTREFFVYNGLNTMTKRNMICGDNSNHWYCKLSDEIVEITSYDNGDDSIQSTENCIWTDEYTCELSKVSIQSDGTEINIYDTGSYKKFNEYGYISESYLLVDGFTTHTIYAYSGCE